MGKLTAILLIISILSLTGCMLMQTEEKLPETSTQADVYDVEDHIDDIDALEKELDLSELDEIEQDLNALNW